MTFILAYVIVLGFTFGANLVRASFQGHLTTNPVSTAADVTSFEQEVADEINQEQNQSLVLKITILFMEAFFRSLYAAAAIGIYILVA